MNVLPKQTALEILVAIEWRSQVGFPSLAADAQSLVFSESCEHPTSYRSFSGPLGPKSQESLKRLSPGLRPWGPRKVWKKSGKNSKCPFETFSRLSRAPGAEAPGRVVQNYFWISGRKARETPVARQGVPKARVWGLRATLVC